MNVGLLATPNFDASLASLPDLPGDWVKQFGDAVQAPPATWLTNSTSWAWIGSPATAATSRPLHPEEPQVVRFTVTFPMPPGATTLPTQWTLFAVVDDPLDPSPLKTNGDKRAGFGSVQLAHGRQVSHAVRITGTAGSLVPTSPPPGPA